MSFLHLAGLIASLLFILAIGAGFFASFWGKPPNKENANRSSWSSLTGNGGDQGPVP